MCIRDSDDSLHRNKFEGWLPWSNQPSFLLAMHITRVGTEAILETAANLEDRDARADCAALHTGEAKANLSFAIRPDVTQHHGGRRKRSSSRTQLESSEHGMLVD